MRRFFSFRVSKVFQLFIIIFLFAFIGIGILGSDQAFASGSSFNVPHINDHFEKVQPGPAPAKEAPVTSTSQKEKEDGDGNWLTKAWNWTKETVSSAWNKTKEVCSEAWDWICNVCDKIAKVVVDGLSAAWNWIVKYKEYIACAAVVIVGVVLCFVAPPLGASVLIGAASSFLISVALNGGRIDKNTFLDAAIGALLGLCGAGIAGGASRALATGVGQKLLTGLAESRFLGPLLRGGSKLIGKLPGPLQKIFTRSGFIGSIEGAGTSVADDLLHGRKINWKIMIFSGIFGAGMVSLVHFAEPAINKAAFSLEPLLTKTPIVKNLFKSTTNCVALNQVRGYFAVATPCINTGLLENDLKNLREKVGTDIDTIAVGRTDVKGLEGIVFEGASPRVIKEAPPEAGLKPLDEEMPNRPIKAPFNPPYDRHAEEMVINKFVEKVDALYPNPQDVKGKLYIHQSNSDGVCPACKSGLGRNPNTNKGILYQLSKRYPNLEIIVSSEIEEGAKITKKHFFMVKNGKQYKYPD
ncbi:hypothetical protein [Thermoactinomyces sp. CICC 10521]|uniref:hypothetical protein n=1 Tax=Thermoactinomyces sp. CICC 10521 TaxID=2767426 RepID=UPI0018DC3483|nr:hypothetical protein [Thermoactinomyces sp. CICC 10521]MBH8609420.1 hypothetical protein [Thermoactinomyces sp. CICC 10521]